jgi:hypothetical protein
LGFPNYNESPGSCARYDTFPHRGADSPAHHNDLNTLEHAFLTTSQHAESRRRRRTRTAAAALVLLLITSLAATGFAIRAARAATATSG